MRVYRYMSQKELDKFLAGEKIVGKKKFQARTNSHGVCFLRQHTVGIASYGLTKDDNIDFSPITAREFLEFVVSDELLVCFDTNAHFNHTHGEYPGDDGDPLIVAELCIDSYSKRGFMLRGIYDLKKGEVVKEIKNGKGFWDY